VYANAFIPPPQNPPDLDPDLIQRGGSLFLDPRISGDGQRSCASCHDPSRTSRTVYLNGEPVDPGTEGARAAPYLRGLYQTAPYLWDGSQSNIQGVIDRMLGSEMRGGKLSDIDREALAAYLLTIPPFDNGRINPDGSPTEPATKSARDGFELFQSSGCTNCHPPTVYTRRLPFDIGTGGKFDVPSLRGLPKDGPLGHDGRWQDLETAVNAILAQREVELTYRQKLSLREYLKLL